MDVQLYKEVYTFWREQAVAVHEATGANMTFTLQPIPVNLVDQGIAKGGNPLGLPRVNHQCKFHFPRSVGRDNKDDVSVADRAT